MSTQQLIDYNLTLAAKYIEDYQSKTSKTSLAELLSDIHGALEFVETLQSQTREIKLKRKPRGRRVKRKKIDESSDVVPESDDPSTDK